MKQLPSIPRVTRLAQSLDEADGRAKVSVQVATTSYLRRMNQRRVVETMARLGKASRVELARVSGMSQPTVSRIVDTLLTQGVLMQAVAEPAVRENDTAQGVGRPSTPLTLDNRKPRFAVLQVGVRKTRLGMLPIAIPPEDRWECEFESPADVQSWATELAAAWDRCRAKGLKAVAISLPGVIDEHTGRVLLSPNLRWTEKADFSGILSSVFGSVPILYCQEIRALALGHLALNADAGDFLLVDSGSGVGAAAIAAGRLYSGPLPLSGELGHTPVLGNKRKCGCGSVGCLETLVSRTGLVASAAENGHAVGWRELLELLAGDPAPVWLKKTLDSTAVTIASALNILGLRQVVLTGGFAELPIDSIEYLRQAILADTMWARFGSVTCVTAPRHRQAGLISLSIDRTLFGARAAK